MNKEGVEILIDAIFLGGELEVFEAYSIPDCELRTFDTKETVLRFIEETWDRQENLVYLSLYYKAAMGFVQKKKITLVPEKCNGAKVRYSVEGWGLIQFQLWNKEGGLSCDIGVNSEKRANAWEATCPELKSPSLWDWKEIQKQNRRLNRVLKKCA